MKVEAPGEEALDGSGDWLLDGLLPGVGRHVYDQAWREQDSFQGVTDDPTVATITGVKATPAARDC